MYHPLPAYLHFLQPGEFRDPNSWGATQESSREEHGLQAIIRHHFPIEYTYQQNDEALVAQITFETYCFEAPREDPATCRANGADYAAPLKLTIRLLIWEIQKGGSRQIRDIKEQEIYFGQIPWMTDEGTFIIEGTDVILLPQIHPDPALFAQPDQASQINPNDLAHQQVWTADTIIAEIIDAAITQIAQTAYERLSRSSDPDCLMPHDLFSTKTLTNRLHKLLTPQVKGIPQPHLMPVEADPPPAHQALLRPQPSPKMRPLQQLYLQSTHPSHQDRLEPFDAAPNPKKLSDRIFKLAPGATIDASGAIQPTTAKTQQHDAQAPKARPPKDPKC